MKFKTEIKNYESVEIADKDSKIMEENGFRWFTSWYTVEGFSVEYRKYIVQKDV